MGKKSKWEYFKAIYARYRKAELEEKSRILDEFCRVCGYNRKYAISKLNGSAPEEGKKGKRRRKRGFQYSQQVIGVLFQVWQASGNPCSVRLKAVLRGWMSWIGERFKLTPQMEKDLLSISYRQIDRRLKPMKAQYKRRIYGRTKPGPLLRYLIPIKTEHWNVKAAGFTQTDTVSHSGPSAEGLFGYTVNQTDILTTWVESRAILGKGERQVVESLDEMKEDFPFAIRGINPDNGTEFINYHLFRYCKIHNIEFTRSRPYKKDDHAHIEQKNWTHVRKLMGWDRYDTHQAIDAMNDLYKNELRVFMNLFTPSMKLQRKVRFGSKIQRVYDQPQTPLDRVIKSGQGDTQKLARLIQLRDWVDPFVLSKTIEAKLQCIYRLATRPRRDSAKNSKN